MIYGKKNDSHPLFLYTLSQPSLDRFQFLLDHLILWGTCKGSFEIFLGFIVKMEFSLRRTAPVKRFGRIRVRNPFYF